MAAIVISGEVRVPEWVIDLDSFRRWARSDEFPRRGWFSFLDGEIWVDPSLEQLFTHNQVKGEYTVVLGGLVDSAQLGHFFFDRARLSHPGAELSTEPDGLFVSWEAFRSGRVHPIKGIEGGYVELEGTPDMVLEVVSAGSVRKDTVELRDLYWKAGIPEYWLVDARRPEPRFDILRRADDGYVAGDAQDGWLTSKVFGRAFQLTRQNDPLGYPQYTLRVQELPR